MNQLAEQDLKALRYWMIEAFGKGWAYEEAYNPFEGMSFQEGHFPTASEIEFHDVVSIGEQNREQEFILSDRDVLHRNPWYTGPKSPHPEELDDDGEPIFGLGYYEVELQHNFIKALSVNKYHNPEYDNGIEDDDLIPF